MTVPIPLKILDVDPKLNFKYCAYCQEEPHKRASIYCSPKCKILFDEHFPYFWKHWIWDLYGCITTEGDL